MSSVLRWTSAIALLAKVTHVPGRFERIEMGQPWTVIIDYAYEPESLRRLYEALRLIPRKRLIHVCGSVEVVATRLVNP